MDKIRMRIGIRGLSSKGSFHEEDFVVDSGLRVSLAPESFLRQAGIRPRGTLTIEHDPDESDEQSAIDLEFGLAVFKVRGELTAGRIIFASNDAEPLLSLNLLESIGFTYNADSGKIERLPAIPLKENKISS